MENYTDNLEGDVKERYINKIDVIGFDPYKLPKEQYSIEAFSDWPDVNYIDIVNYLIFETSAFTQQQLKNYKSLEAYRFFIDGWIKETLHKSTNGRHIILTKVNHSMRVHEKPLRPWVCVKDDGVIESAHCNCMAGPWRELLSYRGSTVLSGNSHENKKRCHVHRYSSVLDKQIR